MPAGLLVLDAATGQDRWDRMVLEAAYPAGMAVDGKSIFVSTPHGEVQAYDLESSRLRWRYSTGESLLDATPYRRAGSALLSDPVVVEDIVLLGGCDGVVRILDAETGADRWAFSLNAPVIVPACALDGGFCVGTFAGMLLRFDW